MIVALLENMHGKIDESIPQLLSVLSQELDIQRLLDSPSKQYKSLVLQALSMAFAYDPVLVFDWLRGTNLTQQVFT